MSDTNPSGEGIDFPLPKSVDPADHPESEENEDQTPRPVDGSPS